MSDQRQSYYDPETGKRVFDYSVTDEALTVWWPNHLEPILDVSHPYIILTMMGQQSSLPRCDNHNYHGMACRLPRGHTGQHEACVVMQSWGGGEHGC